MNAAEFLQVLGKELISSIHQRSHDEKVADVVFQHDNAPVHTTKVTKHCLRCISIKTMFWPFHFAPECRLKDDAVVCQFCINIVQ